MSVVSQIEDLVRPILDVRKIELLETVVRGKGDSQVVEIYIDSENGVTAELCSEVSRTVGRILDEREILRGGYSLTVSSPGIDRPLKTPRQFKRNIGRRLEILTQNQPKAIRGTLVGCDEGTIELEQDGGRQTIPLASVLKARILLPW